jgi:hypothetical protein
MRRKQDIYQMSKLEIFYIHILIKLQSVKDFFFYTLLGRKSPTQIIRENDPYDYGD